MQAATRESRTRPDEKKGCIENGAVLRESEAKARQKRRANCVKVSHAPSISDMYTGYLQTAFLASSGPHGHANPFLARG